MTRSPIARRAFGALLAGLTFLLASCGGGDDDNGTSGTASLRIVNATSDLPSIDVYTNTDKRFSAVATGTITDAQGIGAGSYTVNVTSAGVATALLSGTYAFSGNQHYTGVVWGRTGALKLATLPEDENPASIAAGSSRVRVYNATTDAGSYDVHLTQGIDVLPSDAVPAIGATASNGLTGYREIAAGAYRLRITAAGDPSKVRLDVPAVTLAEKQYATVIVTAGPGGVLVNAALLVQQGSFTALPNTQARMRVVPAVENAASVTVQVDGTAIASNVPSPPSVIAPYRLVPAGSRTVDVLVNGTSVSSTQQPLAAGGDYTLLVYGPPAAPVSALIPDDNRLPATGRLKMRLVNGASTIGPVTLTVDATTPSLTENIALGRASDYIIGTPLTNGATSTLIATSAAREIDRETVTLQPLGIYTWFIVGGGAAPTGVLVKEP